MLSKEEFTELAWQKYDAWQKSQENQTSGYEYEKSFDEMIVSMGNILLQGSVGEVPKNPKKKEK